MRDGGGGEGEGEGATLPDPASTSSRFADAAETSRRTAPRILARLAKTDICDAKKKSNKLASCGMSAASSLHSLGAVLELAERQNGVYF